jgi:hypothetical protein
MVTNHLEIEEEELQRSWRHRDSWASFLSFTSKKPTLCLLVVHDDIGNCFYGCFSLGFEQNVAIIIFDL